jgi:hypothetical protein
MLSEINDRDDLLSLKIGDLFYIDATDSDSMNSGVFLITRIQKKIDIYEGFISSLDFNFARVNEIWKNFEVNRLYIDISVEGDYNEIAKIQEVHKVRFFRDNGDICC